MTKSKERFFCPRQGRKLQTEGWEEQFRSWKEAGYMKMGRRGRVLPFRSLTSVTHSLTGKEARLSFTDTQG